MQANVSTFDIHGKLAESIKTVEDIINQLKNDADPRVRLAAIAEYRRHIRLAAQTLEIAMRAEALKEFQAGVLEALAESRVTIRRKIMGLFESRARLTNSP